jgi:hypothetical protein
VPDEESFLQEATIPAIPTSANSMNKILFKDFIEVFIFFSKICLLQSC